MAEDTYIISWNLANWITVVLMIGLAFFAFGAARKALAQVQSKAA